MFKSQPTCKRCTRNVYPTDKVGPLKDGTYFHHGCFKCYVCGSRLQLKTYFNNREDIADQEVYCSSHCPQANPHDLVPHRSNVTMERGSSNGINGSVKSSPEKLSPKEAVGDLKMQHALKATEIQKPYVKLVHPGARYVLDYDEQTRLELRQREQEDKLYQKFSQQRAEAEKRIHEETEEEWEKALQEFTRRYNYEQQNPNPKAKEELIRHLTLKRDKKRQSLHAQLREQERKATADLVDRQSKEMLDLYRQARLQEKVTTMTNGHVTSGGHTNGHEHMNGHGMTNGHDPRGGGGGGMDGRDPRDAADAYPSTPPPPFPPVGRKRDVYIDVSIFESIDQTAISVAQSEQQTFTDLVWALTGTCRSDVEKARSIYRWITVKNLNLMEFDQRIDPNTPLGILRGIKYGTESYHVLFKRLCSYAGLHCVVIKGFSKSAGYQPGMPFENGRFRNTWNAVFLDGSWRFVQCNWGARHLVNAKDTSSNHSSSAGGGRHGGRSDNLRYEYDDHYFMTDPEEFIYEFFPQQPEWQLLKRQINLTEFEDLPFVRSLFFRYGLSFADPHLRAVVISDKTGAATVALNMSPEALKHLIFHYNLRDYQTEEQEYNGTSLKRFVMQSVTGHSVVFRVHTPTRGEFLLDIFANAISAGEYLTGAPMKFKSVCKFKVVCDHLNMIMVPLPECASGEWGPAKAYRLFGLIPLTHEEAIIISGPILEIKLRMSRPLAEFVASLHKNNVDEKRLQRSVQRTTKGDIAAFRISFPEEGQYGLDIYTREDKGGVAEQERRMNGEKQLLTHCCKYLINVRM